MKLWVAINVFDQIIQLCKSIYIYIYIYIFIRLKLSEIYNIAIFSILRDLCWYFDQRMSIMLIRQECKRRLINRQSLQIPPLSNKAFELTASFFFLFLTLFLSRKFPEELGSPDNWRPSCWPLRLSRNWSFYISVSAMANLSFFVLNILQNQ